MDVPRIIDYGHADPVGQRLMRRVPRLRRRTWVLVGVALLVGLEFVREAPVWQSRELVPSAKSAAWGKGPAISFLPGDHRFVRVTDSGLEMIDLPSGRRTFFSDGQGFDNIISKDGRRLLSGDGQRLRLFDLTSLKRIAEMPLACGQLAGDEFTISADGMRFVVWTPDGAQLWDAQVGKKIVDFPRPSEPASDQISCARITGDQRYAAVLRVNRVDFYRLADGAFDHGFRLPIGWSDDVSFSRDGSVTAAVGVDGKLHIFDAAGADRVPPVPFGSQMNGANIYQVENTDDGKRVLLAGNGKLTLVDAVAGRIIHAASVPWNGGMVYHFSTSPDGRWIVFPGTPAGILIFDARTLKMPSAPSGSLWQNSRPFSPDGQRFISVDSGACSLTVWDTRRWQPLSRIWSDSSSIYNWYLADGSILAGDTYGGLKLSTRHRPEGWYGFAALPIFWIALASAIVAIRSVWRDVWRWHHPQSQEL